MKPTVTPSTTQKLLTLQSKATPVTPAVPAVPAAPAPLAPAQTPAKTARHRAEPSRGRRFAGVFVLGAAVVVGGSLVGGFALPIAAAFATAAGDSNGSGASNSAAASATGASGARAASDVASRNTIVVDSVVGAAGPVTGGTAVTIAGLGLDGVETVLIGGTDATVIESTGDTLTVAVPAVSAAAVGATVDVALLDAGGSKLPVYTRPAEVSSTASTPSALAGTGAVAEAATATETVAAADTATSTPTEAEASTQTESGSASDIASNLAPVASATPFSVESSASLRPAKAAAGLAALTALPLTFVYTQDPRVTAQLDYVLRYWSDYNTDNYGVISGNDCVNFTSQALLERGWTMDSEWYYDASTGQSGSAWNSSTAMMNYLDARPELATALDDSQRAQLKVGDIVQFDWDNSGDRDHTATITKIESTDAGTRVYVGGHTKDSDYWSVDEAIANGGSVYYWSVA